MKDGDHSAIGASDALMWSLARLHAECPYAATVWLALCEIAVKQGSYRVATSRKKLAEQTGIKRVRTLTRSLATLETGGWIQRIHIRTRQEGGFATLLHVVLMKAAETCLPIGGQKTPATLKLEEKKEASLYRGRKTPAIEGAKNVPLTITIEPLVREFY